MDKYQKLTLAVCAVIISTTALSQIIRGGLQVYLLKMGLITAGYLAASFFIDRIKSETPRLILKSGLTINILFVLYLILATLSFAVMPYNGDPILAGIDVVIGMGTPISLWAQRFVTPFVINICSFFYSVFIPYLYFSIFLSLFGRPNRERNIFILAFTVTYSISFMGYFFVPAKGPVVHYANDFSTVLNGGFFYHLVLKSIERCGGPHGAFPSLHVGASSLLCMFDLKYSRVRGLLYAPIVLMITVSTIVLRYHYVADLIAGILIALFAIKYAEKVQAGDKRGLKQ